MAALTFPAFPAVGEQYVTLNAVWEYTEAGRWRKIAGAVMVADASIDTDHLVDGAVTQPKLAGQAVGQGQLADNAVTTAKLLDAAVTQAKLAPLSVDATKLIDNAVTNPRIANGAVTNSKVATNAAIAATKLGVGGSPGANTWLRGDSQWVPYDALTELAHGNVAAALTIDPAAAGIQTAVLTAAALELTVSDTAADATWKRTLLVFIHDNTTNARAITWPASIRWPGGSAPVLPSATANAILIVELLSRHDGVHFGFSHGTYTGP